MQGYATMEIEVGVGEDHEIELVSPDVEIAKAGLFARTKAGAVLVECTVENGRATIVTAAGVSTIKLRLPREVTRTLTPQNDAEHNIWLRDADDAEVAAIRGPFRVTPTIGQLVDP